MDKHAAFVGRRSKRAHSFPSEGKDDEHKTRSKSPRKPHRPLVAFAAKVLPLTPLVDKRDRSSPSGVEDPSSSPILLHPPMIPHAEYEHLAFGPPPKTQSFDSTASQASFDTQTSEILDPWDAPAYDPRIGTDLDSWDNPQLHKILDTLQVAMMNRCHDAHATFPRELNGLVSQLIEAFPVMNRKVSVANWKVHQVTAARERDLGKFRELSREWIGRERDYKAEIKRLEKLLAKESSKGMEAVSLARSRSVVNRSDTMRFVRSLDQVEEEVRTSIDDFDARAEKSGEVRDSATFKENPASELLSFDQHAPFHSLRLEPPRVAFDNNHDREITKKMEQARNDKKNREVILPNHPGRPQDKGVRLFSAHLWQTRNQRKSERQKRIASLKRLDTSKRLPAQPSNTGINSTERATKVTNKVEDGGFGGDSAQDTFQNLRTNLAPHGNETQGSLACENGELNYSDTSDLGRRFGPVDSASSSSGDSDLDAGAQCSSANMYSVLPGRSDTVTQANYNARIHPDCSYHQSWRPLSHILQIDQISGQRRFSFELGEDSIDLSPILAPNEYTGYPFPNMKSNADADTPTATFNMAPSSKLNAATLSHASGILEMSSQELGRVCADELTDFENQMGVTPITGLFTLAPTIHVQDSVISSEHLSGAESSNCNSAARNTSNDNKTARTPPCIKGPGEYLVTPQGKNLINRDAIAAAVAASSKASSSSGNSISEVQATKASYRPSTFRSDV
ncbi:hypothetical protein MGG_06900 [Pyricularia oryzae 70-15]|uniref:Uncharacterized protein n=3 Tax=Pyricularia oryzae TaxID=318829 RepID=G4MMZ9_PYRO7|nr:uncharacterized protein MGG_06900 [Pyricularia oryzae 70-15]EHA57021.1 hypothetical protein MGG_06900 [Pyricularia oryzae 70-15]ELQ43630.1 hypothetical protein OOU_Y34scaffold00140g38 [Pyricularia oryzae Y34]KAI7929763.1 hypothetical protein M9X92_001221 [Pyricularia oryzae]KAI7931074.1 hypothetical protein M0657_001436 [Pyricularia oryzae]